jgi:hypothetical protein
MGKTRRNTRRRSSGGGYQTSQQFFNPSVLPPAAGFLAPVLSSAPTATDIRPILPATFQSGAGTARKSRRRRGDRKRGGFSPSVMGGFIPNAQAAIVPAALYMVYHTLVPKTGKGNGNSRRKGSLVKSIKKMFTRKSRR